MFLVLGEGPGGTEVRLLRPMVGPTGQVVNKLLEKARVPREDVYIGNATCCQPPIGSPDGDRDRAAKACKPRMLAELAQFPGVPILTLGAVAARSVIPQAVLDAIEPPDKPKTKKRDAKDRRKAEARATERKDAWVGKAAAKRLREMIKYRRDQLIHGIVRRHGKRPTRAYVDEVLAKDLETMEPKAYADADKAYAVELEQREIKKKLKPRKKKLVKMTDIMSATFRVDVDGTGERPLIPTIHPAALLRGGGAAIGGTHTPDLAYVNLSYDFLKIKRLAEGKDIWLKFPADCEWADQARAVRLFIDICHEALDAGDLAIDLETYVEDDNRHHALMAYMARIRALGLSTIDRAVSVAWDLLPPWCLSYFQFVLATINTTYHNGLYDRTVLRANGFQLDDQPWSCTLKAHHAAFSGCSHRLQTVATQFFAVEPWKSEFRNNEETPDKLHLYNAKDTLSTAALRPILEIMVKKSDVEKVYERDRAMDEIAGHMHLNGIPISREANTELLNTFTKLAVESRQEVESAANDPRVWKSIQHHIAIAQAAKKRKADAEQFEERYKVRLSEIVDDRRWHWKINNSKHLAALLQATGTQLTTRTVGGDISTKKEILEELVDVPIVRKILTYRENEKVKGTFVWPIFDREVDGQIVQYGFADENDRVHSTWSTHKISGRWASYEPVMSNQTKPKFKKIDGKSVLVRPSTKKQIVAPKGRTFVFFDFAQVEARVIALLSGDPFMLKVFASGLDLHDECARIIFNGKGGVKGYDEMADIEATMPDGTVIYAKKRSNAQTAMRNVTKNVEYGTFYGASDARVWKTLLNDGFNVKLTDVAINKRTLMAGMPGVVKWQGDTIRRASLPPYQLRDPISGRIRQWPMGQVEATEALNIVPQMTGSALMAIGMERMNLRLRKYKEAFPIIQVHDAAAYECWEDDAPAVYQDMNECFPQEYERDGVMIPFPIEGGIADCLAKG